MSVPYTIDAPVIDKPKPFKWSFTKLKNFRTCPKRHYHCDIKREFKESSVHLDWGKTVHKALEMRLERGTQLPPVMDPYEPWAKKILSEVKTLGARIRLEQSLAFDKDFAPTEADWKNPNAWFVAKIDVLIIDGERAQAIDWKTGKVEPDSQQLALSAQCVFTHYPNIKEVTTSYVWLKHDTYTKEVYTQASLLSMWNGLLPEVKQIEAAERAVDYPPTPNGLCREYCPVSSCPYYKKGAY